MAFESLLLEINAEIGRLQQAKALLSGTNGHRGSGRPAKVATPAKESNARRTLSPQARKKIAAAQKKRWAKLKAARPKG
jgi:hypothetical protein